MTAIRHSVDGSADYLRVRIGRTRFLVPVTDPVQVTLLSDGDGAGGAVLPDADVPLLYLDEALQPATGAAASHYRLLLRYGKESIAVACDAADRVGAEGVKLYPLPACMRTPESVFSAAASLGDDIHGVCSAADLLAALGSSAYRQGDTR